MARISGDASDRPMGDRLPNTHRVIKEKANEDQEDRSFRGQRRPDRAGALRPYVGHWTGNETLSADHQPVDVLPRQIGPSEEGSNRESGFVGDHRLSPGGESKDQHGSFQSAQHDGPGNGDGS